MLLRRLPIPERYTSDATINALGFFDAKKEIILYCHSGGRSALASQTLKNMGYTKISHMKGGFKSWMKEIGIIDDFQ